MISNGSRESSLLDYIILHQNSLPLSMTPILDQILQLSVAERILLVEAIWDSIPDKHAGEPLSSETQKILDNRLASHSANPHAGSSWEDVKARIQHK